MGVMTIGEFGELTRLSPKALRLYEELGLVVPAYVDERTGYRQYTEDQIEGAQIVGLLRRLGMPLADIPRVLELDGPQASEAVASYWARVEATMAERRSLVPYLRRRLEGGPAATYDVVVRTVPERTLLSIRRHVVLGETDAFFDEAFATLRAAAPGLDGIDGAPFLIFHGEVSEDGDGPIELCRPVAADGAPGKLDGLAGVEVLVDVAHDDASVRLAHHEMGWPAMLPACDALVRWANEHGRKPSGALRQVLLADQRSAEPDTLVCDLTVPLAPS